MSRSKVKGRMPKPKTQLDKDGEKVNGAAESSKFTKYQSTLPGAVSSKAKTKQLEKSRRLRQEKNEKRFKRDHMHAESKVSKQPLSVNKKRPYEYKGVAKKLPPLGEEPSVIIARMRAIAENIPENLGQTKIQKNLDKEKYDFNNLWKPFLVPHKYREDLYLSVLRGKTVPKTTQGVANELQCNAFLKNLTSYLTAYSKSLEDRYKKIKVLHERFADTVPVAEEGDGESKDLEESSSSNAGAEEIVFS